MDNNISRMPDAYDKNVYSNLYYLLSLAAGISSAVQSDFEDILDSRDLSNAYGETLDNYGAMVGVQRLGATDSQYRTKIRSKIEKNITGTDANSVIKAIASTLDISASDISIAEGNMTVDVLGLTMAMLEASGYSASEIDSMIESFLPIGVSLNRSSYAGTLLIFSGGIDSISQNGGYVLADPTLWTRYHYLWTAWYKAQLEYIKGNEVGLSGAGTVPASFKEISDTTTGSTAEEFNAMSVTGTYSGGTLGILSD